MPQETNLNVTPYFDDFDDKKNFYKVLFKPGYPIQSRELTTLQSILQNQVEKFGSQTIQTEEEEEDEREEVERILQLEPKDRTSRNITTLTRFFEGNRFFR